MFSQKVKHFMEKYFKRSLSPLPSVNPVNYLQICEFFFSVPKGSNGFNEWCVFNFCRVISSGQHILKRDTISLLAPINNCDKVICIGMNYREHCIEQKFPIPTEPIFFNKFASTIIASGDDIIYPEVTTALDWEVELVIVIGKGGKNIKV